MHHRHSTSVDGRPPRNVRAVACAIITAASIAIASLVAMPAQAGAGGKADGLLDHVVFGDAPSEAEHRFASDASTVTQIDGRSARVAQPLQPAQNRVGDLVVTVDVDPAAQNYLSMTFSGDESSDLRTNILIDGEYISYLNNGDYESINPALKNGLPGRIYTATTMLPLESTQGEDSVRVTVRTSAAAVTAAAATPSRSYLDLSTHLRPSAALPQESGRDALAGVGPAPAPSEQDQQALVDSYREAQLARVDAIAAKVDAGPTGVPDIQKYPNELRYYAEALVSDWSPDTTPELQRAALERIFTSIDRYTTRYYGDVLSLGNGGHQSDWGGYYAELGEALYIVENLISDEDVLGAEAFEAMLREPFVTGTTDGENSLAGVDWEGGELDRGEAWERVLKANFDFARSRLSYISNQVHYTYEGAWRSHEGLRVIGSEFYEGKERSHEILREIWGISPFLGEEILVAQDGSELDLYHSLFNHDDNAEYTDDYRQVVMRGLATSALDDDGSVERRKPYGEQYTSLSEEGLLRENNYVGNYGETANWLPTYFWRTWGHDGDEEINAELLRRALENIHARGLTRYQGVTADGHRAMYMEQIVDARNIGYPGKMAYASDTGVNLGMLWASLEAHMVEHVELYQGDEWDDYRSYAREAVGFLQQQMLDGQYFNAFAGTLKEINKDHRLPETWAYLQQGREDALGSAAAGVVLPNTDLTLYSDDELAELGIQRDALDEPSAWVDIDNLFVRLRDDDTTILGSLVMRNYGYLGNGKLHVQRDGQEQLVQVATTAELDYRETTLLADSVEHPIITDAIEESPRPGNARGGQIVPIAFQPGVGEPNRDNFAIDTPYSGYPNLIRTAYGDHLVVVNTTREAHGNAQEYSVRLPDGFRGRSVPDLVSGSELRVRDGSVTVPAHTAVVLRVAAADRPATRPQRVDAVALTPSAQAVGVAWRPSAGATGYRVERAEGDGRFRTVARKVTSTSYLDEQVRHRDYRYRVVALSGRTEAEASTAVGTSVAGEKLRGDWQTGSIGEVGDPRFSARSRTLRIEGAAGNGFGTGDDFNIYERFAEDDLAQIMQPLEGSYSLTAKITGHDGQIAGITVRDGLQPTARYAALGVDEEGGLELRLRTLDTRVNLTGLAGTAGAARSDRTSPRTVQLDDFDVSTTPYLRLDRDAQGQRVIAQVSENGHDWVRVAQLPFTTMAVTHAGVMATSSVVADEVRVAQWEQDDVLLSLQREDETAHLRWTKPDSVSSFRLYRTNDERAGLRDPRKSRGWEIVADEILETGFSERVIVEGATYVVAGLDERGRVLSLSQPIGADGYPLAKLIERARATDLGRYTEASGAAFLTELDAIELDAQAPDADQRALAERVDDALGMLVAVFSEGFEDGAEQRWRTGRTSGTPAAYTQTFESDPTDAFDGSGSLLLGSTNSQKLGAHNIWVDNGAAAAPATPGEASTTYRVTFKYQLEDYSYGSGLGAYLFVRGFNGAQAPAPEHRFWLREPSTAPGEWSTFEQTVTTGASHIDRLVLTIGLRGAEGRFRVDDVKVEPVG